MNADLNYSFLVNRAIHPGQSGHKIARAVLGYQLEAKKRRLAYRATPIEPIGALEIRQSTVLADLANLLAGMDREP